MKIAAALIALMLAGCATVSGPSTVSSVIDKATKSYQSLYCKGLIPPDVAAQVAVQHLEYRRTMDSTHNAAVTAKDGKGAFIAAKESASRFIDVVQLALTKKEIDDLRSQLEKATKL